MMGRKRQAFTLVELLVVIGIIALLISILMPALTKAQEASRRAVCLSNLHQVHLSLMMYSLANKDAVPLGYWSSYKQQNYMVWRQGQRVPFMFGLLHTAGYMKAPQAFYCPSNQDPQLSYDTPRINPWPPPEPGDSSPTNIRIGYGSRPVVRWSGANPWPDNYPNTPFHKLTKFKNSAVVADIAAAPERVLQGHKKGVNVLYGNGAAKWVELGAFKIDLYKCNNAFNVGAAQNNTSQDNIWKIWDRQ